jgi:hypothetical protein
MHGLYQDNPGHDAFSLSMHVHAYNRLKTLRTAMGVSCRELAPAWPRLGFGAASVWLPRRIDHPFGNSRPIAR